MAFIVPDKKAIPELEEEALKFWKEKKIFEKSIDKNSKDNLYVFYDGPPFISGLPHYGHILGSIAKDIVPRYWTMKGKRVERVWGWDAHGLTVENRVQENLGIKNRRDIEDYGLEKFTEACYEYTSRVSAEWEWYVDRIGRWVDFKNAYRTTDQKYMESVIWAFKQLYDKGFIYEGIRTSLYCPTCGTPVSDFEIAMDNSYKEVEDPSITVKFPITTDRKFKGTNLLAWTTTPWTLPSNRALVVDEKETYVLAESEGEKYILAKPRLNFVFKDKKYTVEVELNGKDLIGLEYEPPYRIFASKGGEFKVYSYESMVTMEDGTGIVHSAPGFGEVDTEMGKHYGLTLMMTLDDEGRFLAGTNDKNDKNLLEGVFYLKSNDLILEDLEKRNILFRNEKVVHRVPYHDRCNTLLVQKAQNSWFINVQDIKDKLIETNSAINWVPDYIKHGIFESTIKQAPDWCISRNRFWATPMPIWESQEGDRIVVSSIKEIEELSGQKVTDLHRPYIDSVVIKKDGKEYKRRSEVLDSWMEAGSMPFAQIHYPFENQEKFEKNFPGDYIVEYKGQIRAWFQRMHILSTLLFGFHCFNNCVVTGVMAGSDGRKMSKTYKNYADPKEMILNYGGDALRLYLMDSPLMSGENTNFDETELKTKSRNVLNPLWNSVKYFLIYANLHNWDYKKAAESKNVLDKWIVARVNQVIKDFTLGLNAYNIPPAVRSVEDFVDDLSRWYVRRSRDRIVEGDNEALSTLYYVLVTFAKASAPAIPFVCENIYKNLVVSVDNFAPESVHLCDYPGYDEKIIEESKDIFENMKKARDIISSALSIRVSKAIPVRQALGKLEVKSDLYIPNEYFSLVLDEVNVKEIVFVDSLNKNKGWVKDETGLVSFDTNLTPELVKEGLVREFIRKIQDLRKESGLSVSDEISVTYKKDEETDSIVNGFSDEIKKKIGARNIKPGEDFSIEKI